MIPTAIVMCESKGLNLPMHAEGNPTDAAGYYQIKWQEHGGSWPYDASKHSKAEQDAMAAKIWAGGAGAGNWVCQG